MAIFSEVILKSVVCLNMSERSGHEAVTTLIEAAVKQGVLEQAHMDDAIKAVLKREQSASTAMPDGIALPHGRIDSIKELVCMIGIHPGGVEFGAPDGQLTHIIVQLLVPAMVGCNHIHFLANLSRRLLEQSVRTALLEAASRDQVVQFILCHSDEGSFS